MLPTESVTPAVRLPPTLMLPVSVIPLSLRVYVQVRVFPEVVPAVRAMPVSLPMLSVGAVVGLPNTVSS